MPRDRALFSSSARWIWDDSDRTTRNYYLRARRIFSVDPTQLAGQCFLSITADAYYQVWLNRQPLGHGPAKSPEHERFVDRYEISRYVLGGENVLEILVYSLGVGTMNYCLGQAGLVFELTTPAGSIVSDADTLVQPDPTRLQRTVRRWIMPYLEAVDSRRQSPRWRPATVVENSNVQLLPRPVALPAREPLVPRRISAIDEVRLPEFSCSFRIKPYLVAPDQVRRCNMYEAPAIIVTDLVSDRAQEITLVPTAGQVTWYFQDRKIVTGSGWGYWDAAKCQPVLRLRKGTNRLIGIHSLNHFEEIHVAAFTPHPIAVSNPFGAGGFQVLPADAEAITTEHGLAQIVTALGVSGELPTMDPADTLVAANAQDLAVNAAVLRRDSPVLDTLLADGGWTFPPTAAGEAIRLIVDLGTVQNGWLSFVARGAGGGRFIFSFFEALAEGPPLVVDWPEACNNALSYSPSKNWQEFESFFAYGMRYIAIFYSGAQGAQLRDLQLRTANCGTPPRGAFRSSDVTLNAIYSSCQQTVLSATDDTLTDCPTYEAVNWNFDNRLGGMTDLLTNRNIAVLRNTIVQYTRDPTYPGLVRSHYPSAWENRIPVFSFHWIIFCAEFFRGTSDRQFLELVLPQVVRGMEEALAMIDATGLLRWPAAEKPWHIIDWNLQRDDNGQPVVSGEQGMFLGALDAARFLVTAAARDGWREQSVGWAAARASLRAAIQRHLWLPARDAYADSLHLDGTTSAVTSQPSNSILALYGVGTPAWRRRLARRIAADDPQMLPPGSPMGLFYVLEFLDQRAEVETIFRLIRTRWKPMLDAGDATTWEHFPEFGFGKGRFPTRSRCHPFSTYIVKYLVKYVLGVTWDAKGSPAWRLQPRPPAGIDACLGIVPVAGGVIRAQWKRQGKRIIQQLELPGDATAPSGMLDTVIPVGPTTA